MQERTVTVSHPDLTAALKDWDQKAQAEGWARRTDDQRFADSATMVLDTVESIQRRRHAE